MEPPAKRKKTDSSEVNRTNNTLQGGFLSGIRVHIVLAGIGKVRCDLFKRQLRSNGGMVEEQYNPESTTHIIVDEKMDLPRLCKILKIAENELPNPAECKIVKSIWLSSCLREKSILECTDSFELGVEKFLRQLNEKQERLLAKERQEKERKLEKEQREKNAEAGTSGVITRIPDSDKDSDSSAKKSHPKVGIMYHAYKKKVPRTSDDSEADSDYVASGGEDNDQGLSDDEEQFESTSTFSGSNKPLPKGNWVCARSSKAPKANNNKHITDKLEALAKTYENTNDKWRALGYAKAISVLKAHHKEITTFEEAKALPGVGAKLAEKIWEIIESGELRKLNELTSSDEIQAINLFSNVWGAGATTARSWVSQGFRSLDDLREKANLTRNQKIGLSYYDDLLDRMPREEAAEIEAVVKRVASSIDPGLVCMAQGSYRRGKTTCGDVDVLITHPDGRSHRGVFTKLLNTLRADGFITDDLVSQEDSGNQKKYLGVCLLPGENRKHRRLDIIVVPYDEFACASMYFTGSAHFNRSMRNLAGKMGMSLNEHGLYAGVIRQKGEKITKGRPLHTPDEKSVFKHLGLTYRPPTERDH